MIIGFKERSLSGHSKRAFTLIEIIAVLVLLGILAAIALPRYIDMTASAREKAINAGVAELNGRESLAWGNQMLLKEGAPADADVFAEVGANNLGAAYTWTTAPGVTGGALRFGGEDGLTVTLTRTPSTALSPAIWAR